MKEYTETDCLIDEYNDDGSRRLCFEHHLDPSLYHEVRIESVTLQLSEEVERQNGGTVKEFAALMLNRHLNEEKEYNDAKDFFEDIST